MALWQAPSEARQTTSWTNSRRTGISLAAHWFVTQRHAFTPISQIGFDTVVKRGEVNPDITVSS